MELGTPRVIRCGWVSLCLFVLFSATTITVRAQQPAGATEVTPPAATPAAQPVTQAAPSASAGQAKPLDQNQKLAPKDTADSSELVKLGPGDLVEVTVYNVPELATKARISNSGDLYLPLIDYVHVEGLTQEEAQNVIEKRLEEGGFVRSPHVTIFVDEANSQGVTVLGEVNRPGIYPDPVDRKLYQVISEAGGFTNSAARKVAILRRDQTNPIYVTLPRNLGDEPNGNVDVLPGDTITIPKAPIIYVVGDVGRPSGFLVDNGTLTVLQALALAGGTNHTAKVGAARIIRKTPTGLTETKVALKKMLEAKAPDVTLQADDILFVPVSGTKIAAARGAEAALGLATAVGIYTLHP